MQGKNKQRGLTLFELLVTVSILAAVAGLSMTVLNGGSGSVSERVERSLVRAEMAEIAKALRNFKADTGYFPDQGPYRDVARKLPDLSDLVEQPVAALRWNINRGTGWRGPYVGGNKFVQLAALDDYRSGSVSPSNVVTVKALADPFTQYDYLWFSRDSSAAGPGLIASQSDGSPYLYIADFGVERIISLGQDGLLQSALSGGGCPVDGDDMVVCL